MKSIWKYATTPALLLAVFVACLAMPPAKPAPLTHIAERVGAVDMSSLPPLREAPARDGTALAYRLYGAEDGANVILALHGSGGSGTALHPLAAQLAEGNSTVIVPDMRGHGATGTRGRMDYTGQASDDLDDLLAVIAPDTKVTIVGFSMGGGLGLRYAAARPDRTDEVVLLSPYLAHDAPPVTVPNPYKSEISWAAPSVPRIIALGMLNGIGITMFNNLNVVALATSPEDAATTTGAYDYNLLKSVNPANWQTDLAQVEGRITLIVGAEDELHAPAGFADALTDTPDATLITIPGTDHMGLTLDPTAIQAVVNIVEDLS